MKKWLYSFKFILTIILFIGFAAYYYLMKDSKENFQEQQQQQNDGDYHYPHFDISANYYNLTEAEKAQMKAINPDSIILNIGNSLGEGIDINNIPWDSENRSLQPSEILWGAVSREASADIFHKVYVVQQLKTLQAAEDNKFYFDSAILHYGTGDPELGSILEFTDFYANFASPLIVPMIGEKMGGHEPIFPDDVPESPVTKQTNAAKNIGGNNGDPGVMEPVTEKRPYNGMKAKQHSRVSHILSVDKKPDPPGKTNEPPASTFKRLKSQLFKMKGTRLLGKLILLFFDWIELIPPPVGPVLNFIYMVFIMPAVMAIAMPLIAPRKGSDAIVENRIIGVYTTLAFMAVTAGIGVVFPLFPGAQAAAMAAALAGALAAFYEQKVAIPAGYRSAMEKMIESTGHGSGDGKCPNGYVPMNQLWNPTTEIFLSFVPIFGDLIDLIYPYMCIRTDFMTPANDRAQNFIENLVCVRDPFILPKYMDQSWISSMFLDWPDYNNKLSTGTNIVGGKLRIVPTATSQVLNETINILAIKTAVQNAGVARATLARNAVDTVLPKTNRDPYWSWSGYTNYNDIKNNPQNYYNLDIKLDNFKENNIYQYIGGKSSQGSPNPSLSCRFFYLDFSDPNILVEMAQFYYNYAIRNPQIGDDRTFTIEYIAKINYVVASSLFSCDAMCEMVTIKYDARSGTILKQTRSYDADRRFYFRWRGNSGPPNYTGDCMTPTDIWGNDPSRTVWRVLDDACDEAMYKLNDAIHFPDEPGADSTGLISGEVLLTAYELYLEQKERSDAAAAYIVSVNSTNTDLNTAKAAYDAVDTQRINQIIGSYISDIINSSYSYLGIVNSMPSFLNSIPTIRDIPSFFSKRDSVSSALSNVTNTINIAYNFAINLANNIPSDYATKIGNISSVINNTILSDFSTAITSYFTDSSNATKLQNARTTLSNLTSNANLIIEKATVANNNIMTTGQLGNAETYTQPQDTLQLAFRTATKNYEDALLAIDPFYLDFKINTDTARNNYIGVLSKLYTSNENPNIFFLDDLDFRGPILRDLQSRMDAVINARKDLWDLHKLDVSTTPTVTFTDATRETVINSLNYKYDLDNSFMTSKYYDVTGCTHLDGGALAVITPDVTSLQEDIRFPAKFDVLPHLKRCENINITLDKCIDLSNVEQVIQAYQRDIPNKRIKTIHNIQARGNNTCQYIWDEYDVATPTTITKTTNRILYQQDLSACTFCLPEVSMNSLPKVQKIYIDTSDNKVDVYDSSGYKSRGTTTPITTSLTVGPPPEIKHYSLPVSNAKNPNPTLIFSNANYKEPVPQPDGGQPVNFTPMTGQLLVPRYDPNTYKKLPDLVRPKKPIRVSYPNGTEFQLGGQTSNYCSDPINMSNFMIDYNNTNTNLEKIVNIQRGFTTGSNAITINPTSQISFSPTINPTTITFNKPLSAFQTTIGNQVYNGYTILSFSVPLTNSGFFNDTIVMSMSVGFTSATRAESWFFTLQSNPSPTAPTYYINNGTLLVPPGPASAPFTAGDTFYIIYNGTQMLFYREALGGTSTLVYTATITAPSFSMFVQNNFINFGGTNNYTLTNLSATTFPTCDYEIDVFIKDPKNPDNSAQQYLTKNISNILSITTSGTTIQLADVTGFIKGMIVNISYTTGSISYTTRSAPSYTIVNHNNITPTTQNDIFQAISGLLKITNIDVSNNRITYSNKTLPIDIVLPITTGISGSGIIELKNVVTRKTVSYNMKIKPEAFTNTPYTYNTIGTTGGLEIKKNTPTLQGSFSNTGYNFGGPAKSNADNKFGSNTNFYNDNLVTDYTTKMSNLLNTTSAYLKPLIQAITLSNTVGGPDVCVSQPINPPTNVCSNPTYMQRIMDAYNNGNSPIGIYNQERNTMTRIIQASTASNNECHLIFENKNEIYIDRTYYDSNNSNNYTVTNTLKFMNFPMDSNGATCDFNPKKILPSNVIGASTISIYPPIKASDLTLSYGNNLAPYFSPLRTSGICQVADTAILFNNLSNDYKNKVNVVNNPLRFASFTKLRSLQIGYDKIDYLIEQINTSVIPNETRRFVLRAKFDLAPYPTTCSWSYTNDSFKLQIVLPDSMTSAVKATYTGQSFVDVVNTNSVSLGGSDTVSPLFFDPEYS